MTPKIYRCAIVDDEPIARKIIKNYIEQTPNLECAGEFKNAFEAIDFINENEAEIDILLLDINLPNLNGIAMAKILPKKLPIIFTTAYSEHAVESYELNAVDYLLKPFLFERFVQAVFKAVERLKNSQDTTVDNHFNKAATTVFIKSDGAAHTVLLNDILYCEAMKNYTKVVASNDRTYYPLVPISKFEQELAVLGDGFVRAHRSFLVSKNHVQSVGTNFAMVGAHRIPIGEQFKAAFLAQIGLK